MSGRPRSDARRDRVVKARFSEVEYARVVERAHEAGVVVAEFVRNRALGLKPRDVVRPTPEPRRAPGTPSATAVSVGVERQTVADEIAEAQLDDPAARDAFIKRRAQQLHGSGMTMLVARGEAAKEWARR